ncbi:AAA family ATPase [Salinivibrio socompensis]|uniref:AAA family ATPase n=1 Tax=Salinivibrio socompensis TaxID=1510206 RepID=UPI00047226EE|nr:AAA family ATPase [Salinivibrio socompensis]
MGKSKGSKSKITRYNYRLKKLHIENLKGINDFTLVFDSAKNVTAVVGVNGSGKSTIIHALACAYKPKGNKTSKDFNRLSHFFTPNKDASWDGSEFKIFFDFDELNPAKCSQPINKSDYEVYYKKPGKKQSRWLPIYGRRHERESAYIGLHDLATLSEDKNASRYKEYETEELAHVASDKIKQDMIYVLGREYESLYSCTIKKGDKVHTMFGLELNSITYSEHSMGAGEKRVLNILYTLHSPKLIKGGLLLIDEIDVLLHGAAFKRLIDKVIQRSKENRIEVVFSTHRETISDFSQKINIVGVFNTGNGVLPMPHTNPQVMSQLTGVMTKPLHIYVEDELAEEVVLNLIYSKHLHAHVDVTKFGAWSNAFALLAGKKLMNQDIKNALCVLDGDVCRQEDEKLSECQRHLNGNDRHDDRCEVVEKIKEFKISFFAPEGQKGSPEFNIKKLFEQAHTDDSRLQELQATSRLIQGLNDWHIYFEKMTDMSGQRQARARVLEFLQTKEEWQDYTQEVSEWLDRKAIELRLLIEEKSLSYCE